MLKVIIGLSILFIFFCMAVALLTFADEIPNCFPKFMYVIGIIGLIVMTIIFILLMAYCIGWVILGG